MAGLGTPFISETYSALGNINTPTAGQTIVTLPSSTLGAGYWAIRIIGGAYSTGPVAAAPIVNNINLMRSSTVYAQLFNIPQFGQEEAIWYMILGASDSVSCKAISTETTGIWYNIGLRATRVA